MGQKMDNVEPLGTLGGGMSYATRLELYQRISKIRGEEYLEYRCCICLISVNHLVMKKCKLCRLG